MRGAAPASSTGPPCCSSSGRGTANSPLPSVCGWRSRRKTSAATTARSTTPATTMIRAVAAAVARSVSAGASSSHVALGQHLAHRLGGASTAAPSARQLRFCARAASTTAAAAAAAAADVAAPTSSPSASPPTPSFRAAIDFRALKASLPAAVANVEARRAVGADPELVARLYDEWRALQDSLEKVRTERNDNAKAMKVRGRKREEKRGEWRS
jgi:hypothetical protein